LIPLCHGHHWDVERECYTDDPDAKIESDDPQIRRLIREKRDNSPRQDKTANGSAMVKIDDETRDVLRRKKAEDGQTYDELLQDMIEEMGWDDV
jgi:hypothetical protein